MISIESKDIVLTRISEDEFKISIGDIVVDRDRLKISIGSSLTIPILGMLVQRNNNEALMCKITEG